MPGPCPLIGCSARAISTSRLVGAQPPPTLIKACRRLEMREPHLSSVS